MKFGTLCRRCGRYFESHETDSSFLRRYCPGCHVTRLWYLFGRWLRGVLFLTLFVVCAWAFATITLLFAH